jgi:DNA-binding CsgD family transcriptional regulator
VLRTEFVGRERELTVLSECLAAALAGEPRVVVCRGEPGIGKTRLSEELALLARAERVQTMWARAVESDGAPPYWPWRQLLRGISDLVDVASWADQHGLTTDLGRLAPDAFPVGGPNDEVGSSEDRFRQFDAVGRLLRHVAARTPLVVVFDDVHWADKPSLLLLQHVVRTLTDERLLLVVNHRDTEKEHSAIVTDLLRASPTRDLHLSGLSAPAIARQLTSAVGHEVSGVQVEEVRGLTGGNPFFVGEVARFLAEPGRPGGRPPVSANVREAIATRLDRLSTESARLLQAASIVGREASLPLVAAVAELPVSACLAAFDEASAAGLVEPGSTPAQHQFVHALVRDAIEAGLPTADRVRLHRRAAQAIERLYADGLEAHLFDLARHWSVAAVQDDAIAAATWIRRAAEEAMHRLAFEEAARLYRLALHVAGAELGDAERCQLLLSLGGALHASADVVGRLDACLHAAAVARRIGRVDLIAEAALILEGVFGHPASDIAARRLAEEALAGLDPSALALRARVSARFAESCMYLGDEESAGPASTEALSLAEESGDRGALVAALHARRLVCEGPGGVSERERLSDWMLALDAAERDASVQMWGRLWRLDTCFERGDLLSAARELEVLAVVTQEVGGPWARWQLLRGQAVLAQAQARFVDALRLATEASNVIAPTGHPIAALPRAGLLQTVGHHIGQDDASLAASGVSEAPIDVADFTSAGVVMMVLGPAHMLSEVGRRDEAAALYRSLGPPVGWRPHAHGALVAYSFGLGLAVALEDADDVASLGDLLAPYRGMHVASGAGAVAYVGPVELWLGVGSRFLGQLDQAVVDLEHAVRACAVSGARGFHAEAQHELATTLARRTGPGDLARARSLAAEAGRQATELGMSPVASAARGLLERLDAAEPPAPLTRREREIAELVTKGLTSREIAERLYLSERTVQNHVQHILTKLDLSNRSQIAVWVTVQK